MKRSDAKLFCEKIAELDLGYTANIVPISNRRLPEYPAAIQIVHTSSGNEVGYAKTSDEIRYIINNMKRGLTVVYFIAITFGYWGRGRTEPEAIKQCLEAGATLQDTIQLYRIECLPSHEAPSVLADGTMCWHGDREKIGETVNGLFQPA